MNDLVEIYVGQEWKAAMIRDMLMQNGIRAVLKNEFAPFRQTEDSGMSIGVLVDEIDVTEAQQLIAAME